MNRLFNLTLGCALLLLPFSPIYAQKEKKEELKNKIENAIDHQEFKIDVKTANPQRGRTMFLTSSYSIELRNDSLFSQLPFYGRAYSIPYGGGQGLVFNAPYSDYTVKKGKKKDRYTITLKANSEEDKHTYQITIFDNGSVSLTVNSHNRETISFNGDIDLTKEDE